MTPRQRHTVVATLPGVALAMLHSAMIDLPRADIIDALDTDRYRFHWIQGTYLIGAASGMAMTRFVGSRLGLRRAYLLGVLLFTLLAGLCSLAAEVVWMAPPRLLQGFGMGLLISVAMVLLWRELPEQREWAMAGYALAVYLAAILGATLGGLLTGWASWRLIFLANVPLGLLVASVAWAELPPDAPAGPVPFDLLGFLLLVLSIGTCNVVLDMGQYWGWLTSPFFVPWLAGFVVFFIAFVVWGIMGEQPLISLRPFALRNFGLGLGIKALFSINLYVLLSLLAAYMINLRGYQWWQGGLVLLPGLVTMLLAVRVGLRWTNPTARKVKMALGLLVMAATTWRIAAVDLYTSKVLLATEFAVWAAGAGLVLAPIMLTVFEGLTADQAAAGAGLFNLFRSLPAFAAGMLLATLLTRTTDFYADILGRNLTADKPQVQQVLQHSKRHFHERGSPGTVRNERALAFLRRWLRDNSRAYAFGDVLQLLALVPVLGIPLVFFVRTSPAE